MANSEYLAVANTTYRHIGRQAFYMWGAKNHLATPEHGGTLTFKVGRNSKGVNYVKVYLVNDEYSLEFRYVAERKGEIINRLVSSCQGVYVDNLTAVIADHIGMDYKI